MKIRLRVLGSFRNFLGDGQHEVDLLDGSGLPELMEWIHTRWGESLPFELWDAKARRAASSVLVMIDGRRAETPGVRLADGQEVILMMLVVGG